MINLSVIIVSYNTREHLYECLQSLMKFRPKGITREILVVDNGSADGSAVMVRDKFPEVRLIISGENLGFARANNLAIRKSHGEYILLLNSDTLFTADPVSEMLRFMDQKPRAAVSTCKLILPDGNQDPACHRGFPTPWAAFTYIFKLEKLFPESRLFGQYHQGYKDLTLPHEVDCISGAFFLIRRKAVDSVGLLDEDYFMYAEDIDWCYRIRLAGWQIWFNPEVSVLHKKMQSGRQHNTDSQRQTSKRYFHVNNLLFYRKHYQKKYGPVITFLVNMFYKVRLIVLDRTGF